MRSAFVGSNCTENQYYASSHSAEATSAARVRLSAGVLAKLRGELRRLARSDSPEVIRFANVMMTRYPELRA
jgi:hypothetical protein